jgi:hypothetical protein
VKGTTWRVEQDIGEPPCAACQHVAKCRLGFACDRFRQWATCGIDDATLGCVPMRSIFRRLFPVDAAPLVDALLLAARKPARVAA